MPTQTTLKKSDVFVSYGRKESKHFAGRLAERLSFRGYEVWIDQRDIPLAIDFQEQINDGINRADNFIFVIAPHAIKSEYCLREIELAIKLNKRIIPILHIESNEKELQDLMHPVIRKLNWTYFREKFDESKPLEQWQAIDNFEESFEKLILLIETHKEYVETHTQLLIKALQWSENKRNTQFLLTDLERENAEKWFTTAFDTSLPPCTPSLLHADFISESRKVAFHSQTDVYICFDNSAFEFSEKLRWNLMLKNYTAWNEQTDIKSGMRRKVAQKTAIENADNFIFCITPQSVTDYHILEELDIAVKYKKRIIPLIVEKCNEKDLPPKLRTSPSIDFSQKNLLSKAFDTLIFWLKEDSQYYNQHKIYLVQALLWERQHFNPSILLRGFALEKAKTWLILSEKKNYRPTSIHTQFITESENKAGNLITEVFIAYSRADSDTARKINFELQMSGKNTWFDQESMAQSANIRNEIRKGIEEANNFVFLISPTSVASEYCKEEINFALSVNKRIVPVMIKPTNVNTLSTELRNIHWINFFSIDFDSAYNELIRTLDTDRDYIQNHTKWLRKATEWKLQTAQQPNDHSFLLRGSEFIIAKEWLSYSKSEKKQPAPTPLIEEFIEKSFIEIQKDEEKEKNHQAELLKLQKEKTDAALERLELEKRSSKRQRIMLAFLFVALLFSIFASVMAVVQRIKAEKLRVEAENQRDIAHQKTELAERNEQIAQERLIQLENEKEKVKTSQSETQKVRESLYVIEEEKQAALSIIEQYEAEKRKIEEEEGTSRRSKEKIEEYDRKIKEQRSKMLMAYARNEYKSNKKLSFKLAERAYNEDNTNTEAYRICINSYYDLFEPRYIVVKHNAEICAANFSPDNSKVVTASWDNTARLSDKKGKMISELRGHTGIVNYAAFSADGVLIITAGEDKTVRIWNQNGVQIKVITAHNQGVSTAVFSKNKKRILTAGKDGYVYLMNDDGKILEEYKHPSKVSSAFFSPDEKSIITSAYDNNIRIWSIDAKEIRVFARQKDVISSACFSPNGSNILTAGWDMRLRIYDNNRNLLLAFSEHDKKLSSASYSPDGKFIISTAYDANMVYYMPISIDELSREFDSKTGGFDISEAKLKGMGIK